MSTSMEKTVISYSNSKEEVYQNEDLMRIVLSKLPADALCRVERADPAKLGVIIRDPTFLIPYLHNLSLSPPFAIGLIADSPSTQPISLTGEIIPSIDFLYDGLDGSSPESLVDCNGLFLAFIKIRENQFVMVVTNPSTKQRRYIPPPPILDMPHTSLSFAFGFDPKWSADYSILMHGRDLLVRYNSGTQIWEIVDIPAGSVSLMEFTCFWKGDFYWLNHNNLQRLSTVDDIASNPLKTIGMPHTWKNLLSFLGAANENLHVVSYNSGKLAIYERNFDGLRYGWGMVATIKLKDVRKQISAFSKGKMVLRNEFRVLQVIVNETDNDCIVLWIPGALVGFCYKVLKLRFFIKTTTEPRKLLCYYPTLATI